MCGFQDMAHPDKGGQTWPLHALNRRILATCVQLATKQLLNVPLRSPRERRVVVSSQATLRPVKCIVGIALFSVKIKVRLA